MRATLTARASLAAALVLVITLVPAGVVLILPDEGALQRFTSEAELVAYLGREDTTQRGSTDGFLAGGGAPMITASFGTTASDSGSSPPPTDFSGTNNQVAGVDEPDIVKTDGTYLYVARAGEVVIVRAHPADRAAVVARIPRATGMYDAAELFVHRGRLFVIGTEYAASDPQAPYSGTQQTLVRAYSVLNPALPALVQETRLPGRYVGARLLGDQVYVLAATWISLNSERNALAAPLPSVTRSGQSSLIHASDIGYLQGDDVGRTLLTILATHVRDTAAWTYDVLLVRSPEDLYMSAANLYVRGSRYDSYNLGVEGGRGTYGTSLHRFAVDGGAVRYRASGFVPGHVLNQFAMDEYQDHLRVATSDSRSTAVYVLDLGMAVVGAVEGIAPGESMHSARFAGDRAYLVTFKKIDPFFVLDVSDPRAPQILGELKIPGYSDYLHPYDEDFIIGLGKDTHDMGSFAWFQGIKLSLFDVRDMSNPREVASYVVGDRGTNSEALFDHHAFLFSRQRNLLVLPINLAEVPDGSAPNTYGQVSWVGAYVFYVDSTGFTLRGGVEHDMPDSEYSRYGGGVRRSLYIEDNLYTVSDHLVKVNALDTLAELKAVPL